MADAAQRRMSIEEFLAWQGVAGTRYELRNGVPVAMAPPARAHAILAGNLAGLIFAALRSRPPCAVHVEAGLRSPINSRSYYQADIAVSCSAASKGEQELRDPILVIEVLSGTTVDDDRRIKLPDYRVIESVQEIVLIDSRFLYGEVHKNQPDGRWIVDLLRRPEDRLRIETVGLDLALEAVYSNVPLEEAS